MFIVSIIVAIIIGFLSKGSLSNLKYIRIKGIAFIFASFAVELVAKILLKMNMIELGVISFTLHFITYMLIFIMIFKNKHSLGMKFLGIGTLLNAIVILCNGGIMPIGTNALKQLEIPLTSDIEGMYHIANEATRLLYLGDILPVHLWKIGFIVSVGDIFIMIGLIVIIVQTMTQIEQTGDLYPVR